MAAEIGTSTNLSIGDTSKHVVIEPLCDKELHTHYQAIFVQRKESDSGIRVF